jgi:hypothetical protein
VGSSEFWIALAGLAATVISSAIGFYYTHRARTASYREHLYLRQVETIELVLDRASDLYLLMGDLTGDQPDLIAHDKVWHKAAAAFNDLAALSSRATASLPSNLLNHYNRLNALGTKLLVDLAKEYLPMSVLGEYEAALQAFANISRELLGVDPLSDESRALFASQRSASNKLAAANVQLRMPRPNP